MKNAIFSLFLTLLAFAGVAGPMPPSLPPDRSPVVARRPDPALWERLRTDRAYQYGHDVRAEEGLLAQLWARFLRGLAEWLYDPARQSTRDGLTVLLVVGVAVFVVWKLLGMSSAGLLGRRNAALNVPYSLESENIHAIAFDEEIAAALEKQQYRLAVRLYYLRLLKHLTDADLIDWKPDKTNHVYANELRNAALRPGFEALTNAFERVWYGDFPLEKDQFETIRLRFDAFHKTIPAFSR